MSQLTHEDAVEFTAAVKDFTERSKKLEGLPAAVNHLAGRSRRTIIVLCITIFGLLADGGVSVLFWRQHIQQDCLSQLRVEGAQIADSDRKNVDTFFAAVVGSKTPAEFAQVYANYKRVRDMNDQKRTELGQANSHTCPLF